MTTTLSPMARLHIPRDPGPIPEALAAPVLRIATRRARMSLEGLSCACASQQEHEVSLVVGAVDGRRHVHRCADDSRDDVVATPLYDSALAAGRSTVIGLAAVESDGHHRGDTLIAADAIGMSIAKAAEVTPWSPDTPPGDAVLAAVSTALPEDRYLVMGAFSVRITNAAGSLTVDRLSTGAFTTVTREPDSQTGTFALRFQRDDGDYVATFRVQGAWVPASA
jgi:hypothetical protein